MWWRNPQDPSSHHRQNSLQFYGGFGSAHVWTRACHVTSWNSLTPSGHAEILARENDKPFFSFRAAVSSRRRKELRGLRFHVLIEVLRLAIVRLHGIARLKVWLRLNALSKSVSEFFYLCVARNLSKFLFCLEKPARQPTLHLILFPPAFNISRVISCGRKNWFDAVCCAERFF